MLAVSRQSRPVTLDELIGQDHVKSVLSAAVAQGRIGHAYLFSGPRGVGKTTSARLLAMAVNCDAETNQPCGVCESCLLVQQDSHPDVTELDAASHNSVDDIRELREHVGLASLRGGRRVWILDEAHMLSRSAANALLKTLEEPPTNTLFILATTEPEKLPPTILSRCQHFRFRRLLDEEIAQKLRSIIKQAGKAADDDAVAFIAAAADGAMRDAESLLERLLVTAEPITLAMVEETLGLPPAERLQRFVHDLFAADLPALMTGANELYWEGFAPRTVAEQLARQLRQALHDALAGTEPYAGMLERVLGVLERADAELERFVRQNDLYALELYLVNLYNSLHATAPAPAENIVHEPAPATPAAQPTAKPPAIATPQPAKPPAPAQPAPQPATPTPPQAVATPEDVFPALLAKVEDGVLKAFLAPATITKDGATVNVHYQKGYAFHHGKLQERADDVLAIVQGVFGPDATLNIVLGDPPPKAAAAPRKEPTTPRPPTPSPAAATPPKSTPQSPPAPAPVKPTAPPEASPFDDEPLPTDPFAAAPLADTPRRGSTPRRGTSPDRPPARTPQSAPPPATSGGSGPSIAELETAAEEKLTEMQELFPGAVLRYSWEQQPDLPGEAQTEDDPESFEETP